jgi:hypothetical protein
MLLCNYCKEWFHQQCHYLSKAIRLVNEARLGNLGSSDGVQPDELHDTTVAQSAEQMARLDEAMRQVFMKIIQGIF